MDPRKKKNHMFNKRDFCALLTKILLCWFAVGFGVATLFLT